jgi:hypothetical protein
MKLLNPDTAVATRSQPLWTVLLTIMAMTLMTGCEDQRPPSGDLMRVDYQAPISAAVRVGSVQKANRLLSFKALRPRGLGAAGAVLVTDPKKTPRQSRAIAFLFNTQRYGRVDVAEEPAGLPRAEYDSENRALLAENGSPQTHGSASIVTVRGNKQALITTGEGVTTSDIFWIERRGVEISIIGPSLDASDCVKIANAL